MAGFAEKVTTFAPLTRQADSFSAHTYAKPDYRSGRLAVAEFRFPQTQRIGQFRMSYNGKKPDGPQQPEEES